MLHQNVKLRKVESENPVKEVCFLYIPPETLDLKKLILSLLYPVFCMGI